MSIIGLYQITSMTKGKEEEGKDPTRRPSTTEKENKNKSSFTNECKLEGHEGHEWADCINNSYSKNFKVEKKTYNKKKSNS